jgi:hypothetical protein
MVDRSACVSAELNAALGICAYKSHHSRVEVRVADYSEDGRPSVNPPG